MKIDKFYTIIKEIYDLYPTSSIIIGNVDSQCYVSSIIIEKRQLATYEEGKGFSLFDDVIEISIT